MLTAFNISQDEILSEVRQNSYWYLVDHNSIVRIAVIRLILLGVGAFVTMGGGIAIWMTIAELQTRRVRELWFRSALSQHVAWFDAHRAGELRFDSSVICHTCILTSSELATDSVDYHDGIGEKVASYLQVRHCCIDSRRHHHSTMQNIATFFVGVTVGLVRGWQLALLILAATPFTGAH